MLVSVALVRASWLCDDAMISFRTVLNFAHGYGPNYNLGERVQAYTHPLWFMCLTLVYLVTHELFVTTMILSLVLILAALALIPARIGREGPAALIIVALAWSKPFVEFSSSGLEGPLSHLCLALFMVATIHQSSVAPRRLWLVAASASAVVLTRMDLALLIAPALAWVIWRSPRDRHTLVQLVLRSSPVIAWCGCSLLYYGALVPNTYYAKLHTEVPKLDYIAQGLRYLAHSARDSPPAFALIGLAIVAGFSSRRPLLVATAVGIVAHLVYVVWVGGDFMIGRSFAAPTFVAALLLAQLPRPTWPWQLAALAGVLVLGGSSPPLIVQVPPEPKEAVDGVIDERLYYYANWGLLTENPNYPVVPDWLQDEAHPREIRVAGMIGGVGLELGPNVHILDIHALTEPLLAQLPAVCKHGSLIGHFTRVLPAGYLYALRTGKAVDNPRLEPLSTHLRRITHGPLLDAQRLRSISLRVTGGFDKLVDVAAFQLSDDGQLWGLSSIDWGLTQQLFDLPAHPLPKGYALSGFSSNGTVTYLDLTLPSGEVVQLVLRHPSRSAGARAVTEKFSLHVTGPAASSELDSILEDLAARLERTPASLEWRSLGC